jgi:hypothetical protein
MIGFDLPASFFRSFGDRAWQLRHVDLVQVAHTLGGTFQISVHRDALFGEGLTCSGPRSGRPQAVTDPKTTSFSRMRPDKTSRSAA